MTANLSSQSPKFVECFNEFDLRIELAAAYQLIDKFNLSDLISTHISVRLPDKKNHFLLNPFGKMFHEIKASNLVEVDLEGNVFGDSKGSINPAAFFTHSAIYMARDDLNCVFHTHSRYGVAVSALECGLLPISQFAMQFYDRVAYLDYEGTFITSNDRIRIGKTLGNKPVMFLRNHGLLTTGRTIAEAFIRTFYLERSCEVQILAQSSGEKLVVPPKSICELSAQQQNSDNLGQLEWVALLRMLEQESPSYKD